MIPGQDLLLWPRLISDIPTFKLFLLYLFRFFFLASKSLVGGLFIYGYSLCLYDTILALTCQYVFWHGHSLCAFFSGLRLKRFGMVYLQYLRIFSYPPPTSFLFIFYFPAHGCFPKWGSEVLCLGFINGASVLSLGQTKGDRTGYESCVCIELRWPYM